MLTSFHPFQNDYAVIVLGFLFALTLYAHLQDAFIQISFSNVSDTLSHRSQKAILCNTIVGAYAMLLDAIAMTGCSVLLVQWLRLERLLN